jgi:queuine tRNA-ribosyltransferase
MYKILKKDGTAKRAEFTTVHGTVQTPVFMNVATVAAIKGGVSTEDLEGIGTQVVLSNTYHLHLRPGDDVVYRMGGLHKFMSCNKPILTDSGGFQVFSLAKTRRIKEEGVYFHSHIDGHKLFMGPEESMRIQSHLGSTIAMAFDECPSAKAEHEYVQMSVDRTTRWLKRCQDEMRRLNGLEHTVNPNQLLFGINQGAIFDDIRIEHAKRIADMNLDGYAVGGLAVGETHEEMYHVLEKVVPFLPEDKPTYLMGVGTPANILEAVERGVDFFDCVYPSRNGRHGHLYTNRGHINLMNARYELDDTPIEEGCQCPACRRYSKAYIRHLLKSGEMLGLRLCVLHNLYFYNHMMEEIRDAIDAGKYQEYKRKKLAGMEEFDGAATSDYANIDRNWRKG